MWVRAVSGMQEQYLTTTTLDEYSSPVLHKPDHRTWVPASAVIAQLAGFLVLARSLVRLAHQVSGLVTPRAYPMGPSSAGEHHDGHPEPSTGTLQGPGCWWCALGVRWV